MADLSGFEPQASASGGTIKTFPIIAIERDGARQDAE